MASPPSSPSSPDRWDEDQVSGYSGAERLVDVTVESVHQQTRAMPARWNLIEPWRHNPPVN
jgi:hypothetical protein